MSQPPVSADIPLHPDVSELRSRIEKLEAVVRDIDVAKLKLVLEFANAIGVLRCSLCRFNNNGVCTGLKLSKEFADRINALAGPDAVVQVDNIYRASISKLPFLGAICPMYAPKA